MNDTLSFQNNMKILSYNINGLNAFYKSGKLDKLFKDFPDVDVFCLQETKIDAKRCTDILREYAEIYHYEAFINPSVRKKGYAGTAVLLKHNIIYRYNKEDRDYDYIFENNQSQYISGRMQKIRFLPFDLYNIYHLNSGNKDEERKYLDEELTKYFKSLDRPYIICGDLNVCHTDLDYWAKLPETDEAAPGLKLYERNNFDRFLTECNLIDAYRYLYPEKKEYSWYSQRFPEALTKNHGWRIDYFLVSDSLKDHIKNCTIYSGYNGADHSPILLEIN